MYESDFHDLFSEFPLPQKIRSGQPSELRSATWAMLDESVFRNKGSCAAKPPGPPQIMLERPLRSGLMRSRYPSRLRSASVGYRTKPGSGNDSVRLLLYPSGPPQKLRARYPWVSWAS